MAQRRTLSTAIKTVPNADPAAVRQFVTQEADARPQDMSPSESQPTPESERLKGTAVASAGERAQPPLFQPVGLIPITVRLRAEIAGALKRASLERQLAAAEFFSQQEIVERALTRWLSEHGHLNC